MRLFWPLGSLRHRPNDRSLRQYRSPGPAPAARALTAPLRPIARWISRFAMGQSSSESQTQTKRERPHIRRPLRGAPPPAGRAGQPNSAGHQILCDVSQPTPSARSCRHNAGRGCDGNVRQPSSRLSRVEGQGLGRTAIRPGSALGQVLANLTPTWYHRSGLMGQLTYAATTIES
jgi:hypothetical protein